MKLPSLQYILDQTLQTYRRFPFAVLSAVVGTGSAIYIVQEEVVSAPYLWLYKTSAVGFLGISVFTLSQLWSERRSLSAGQWTVFHALISAVLVAYALLLPDELFNAPSQHVIRLVLLAAAAHFFVASGPFIRAGTVEEFWEFNKALFLRFLTAALYTVVLFAGLSIAMVAVENLFNVDILNKRYGQLWWFLSGLFNTWFFLSGIPRLNAADDGPTNYPRGLKIFAQYVLLPLVAIYFAILYAYMVKIVVEWDWPKGWVGYLVLGFSTTGIFSLLLIHPIKDALENRWMAAVTRHFYSVILAPAVLLLLAIFRRISEYGITENRYIVVVLGLWIVGIALYFMLNRWKSIKTIPLSLGILSLAASAGPWSASSVSLMNQMGRLEEVLTRTGILKEGRAQLPPEQPSFQDRRRISGVVRYIVDTHGTSPLQPWFDVALDSVESVDRNRWRYTEATTKKIVELLGVDYVSERQTERSSIKEEYIFTARPWSLSLRDGTTVYAGNSVGRGGFVRTAGQDGDPWTIRVDEDGLNLTLEHRDERTLSVSMLKLARDLTRSEGARQYISNEVSVDSMTIDTIISDRRVRILFPELLLMKDSSGTRVESMKVDLYVTPRR